MNLNLQIFIFLLILSSPKDGLAQVIDLTDIKYSDAGSVAGAKADAPGVAYNPDDDEYLVVYSADLTTIGSLDVYAQRVNASTGQKIGNPLKITSMTGGLDALTPDAVYNDTNNEYLIIWNTGPSTQKVVVRRVAKDLSMLLGSEVTISNTTTVSLFLLGNRIAWNHIDNEYFIVWNSVSFASVFTCRDISARYLDANLNFINGGIITVDVAICAFNSFESHYPDVVFNADRKEFLIVYRGANTVWNDFEIYYERYDEDGNLLQNRTALTNTGATKDADIPRVSYNQGGVNTGKYLVVFQGDYSNVGDYGVYAQTIDAFGVTVIGSHIALSTIDNKDDFYGAVTFNSTANEFLTMWQPFDFGFPTAVEVQRLAANGTTKLGSIQTISSGFLNNVKSEMAVRNGTLESLIVFEIWSGVDECFGRRFTTNNNPSPDASIAVANSPKAEDAIGTIDFTITFSSNATSNINVNFTISGTADDVTDYAVSGTGVSYNAGTNMGTATVNSGSNNVVVTIDPTSDNSVESDETVTITINSGTGYNVGSTDNQSATITNDDTEVTIAVSGSPKGESSGQNMVYTFTRTGVTSGNLIVNFSITGTANPALDYSVNGHTSFNSGTGIGTITIADGQNAKQLLITPTGDSLVEGNETVIVNITAP